MKKEDLLLVFDFLATALKSNIQPENKATSTTTLEKSSAFDFTDTPDLSYVTKKTIPKKFNIDLADKETTEHIKVLMDKLDNKRIFESTLNQSLNKQKKDFERIIKDIKNVKEEQVDLFLKQKIEDESEVPQPTGRINNYDIITSQDKPKDELKNGLEDKSVQE